MALTSSATMAKVTTRSVAISRSTSSRARRSVSSTSRSACSFDTRASYRGACPRVAERRLKFAPRSGSIPADDETRALHALVRARADGAHVLRTEAADGSAKLGRIDDDPAATERSRSRGARRRRESCRLSNRARGARTRRERRGSTGFRRGTARAEPGARSARQGIRPARGGRRHEPQARGRRRTLEPGPTRGLDLRARRSKRSARKIRPRVRAQTPRSSLHAGVTQKIRPRVRPRSKRSARNTPRPRWTTTRASREDPTEGATAGRSDREGGGRSDRG